MKRTRKPTKYNRFLSNDGYYYNGYMNNPDYAEYIFGEFFRKIATILEAKIRAKLQTKD